MVTPLVGRIFGGLVRRGNRSDGQMTVNDKRVIYQ
jgi:hypothetical protein